MIDARPTSREGEIVDFAIASGQFLEMVGYVRGSVRDLVVSDDRTATVTAPAYRYCGWRFVPVSAHGSESAAQGRVRRMVDDGRPPFMVVILRDSHDSAVFVIYMVEVSWTGYGVEWKPTNSQMSTRVKE